MTFLELLEKSADELERMSDEELLTYLGPCLKDCPPIDIRIVNEEEAKIKLQKLETKLKEKELKKAEKTKLRAESNSQKVESGNVETNKVNKNKQKITQSTLDLLAQMQKNLETQIQLKKLKEQNGTSTT